MEIPNFKYKIEDKLEHKFTTHGHEYCRLYRIADIVYSTFYSMWFYQFYVIDSSDEETGEETYISIEMVDNDNSFKKISE